MTRIECEFVDVIPPELEEGVLYISIKYKTALHKCCCGCGEEVVTPIGPTDWSLTYDGETVSLYPSIGNWSYPCQSHYWITKGEIYWAESWSYEQILEGRENDKALKEDYYPNRTERQQEADVKWVERIIRRIKSFFSVNRKSQ